MPAIDFPDSPQVNDVLTPGNRIDFLQYGSGKITFSAGSGAAIIKSNVPLIINNNSAQQATSGENYYYFFTQNDTFYVA